MDSNVAVIESTVGAFKTSLGLPTGKSIDFDWNEKNGFKVEVSRTITYTDPFGKEVTLKMDYAKHLLTNYPHLKLVSEKTVSLAESVSAEQEKQAASEKPKKSEQKKGTSQ